MPIDPHICEIPTVTGGFEIVQKVEGRSGTLDRLLARIERVDGAWCVFPPESQAVAAHVLVRKDTARRRGMAYARERAVSTRR